MPTVKSILKKLIIFDKFTGRKNLQEIRIYLYGISKVHNPFTVPTTYKELNCWFNYLMNKAKKIWRVLNIYFLPSKKYINLFAKSLDY